jgi:membrane protein
LGTPIAQAAAAFELASCLVCLFAVSLAAGAVSRSSPDQSSAAPNKAFDISRHKKVRVSAQIARAREPGRGRQAASPAKIPWKGWSDILWRTAHRAGQNRLLAISAGIVFYCLLALFPGVTALVSSYGLFAKVDTIQGHMSFLAGIMPSEAYSIVQDQIARVAAKGGAALSFSFAAGLGVALWSANAGMKAVMDALNIVYEEDEKRGFVRLTLISLTFTVAAIVAMLVAVGAIVVAPLVLSRIGLGEMTEAIVGIARWPALIIGMPFGLSILYRYGPSRREAKWSWLSVGAIFATCTWFAGSALLSYYFSKFANYDATYGSLGAAIGTMMWMWMSAIVVLLGAELNAETEHQTARDTTVGREKPLGTRGATMADTIGAAQFRWPEA